MIPPRLEVVQPMDWVKPRGYANGIVAEGRTVFVAGQVGWTAHGLFETDDFVGQVDQALRNVVAVLRAGGAGPEHLVRMTWYVTDKQAYVTRQREVGEVYRRVIGRYYPAMTLVVIAGLLEDRALVEIEATAVIPAGEHVAEKPAT
jgi:enamine deaminase RidA (YjgF/YER057c/UK114 family)